MEDFTFFENYQKLFADAADFVVRDVYVGNTTIKIAYIDNLIKPEIVESGIVIPLSKAKGVPKSNASQEIVNKILMSANASVETQQKDIENKMLSGFAIVFVPNQNNAIAVAAQGFEKRAIAEPPTSAVIKGPREGFTESFSTNISLIRRRLKTRDLKVQKLKIGQRSSTDVAVLYISGIADKCVVKEVLRRLKSIEIDAITDSFYLESMLEEKMNTIFKQVGSSEKPDIIGAKLLEGRVAVIADGSPIVLTVPYLFIEDLQAPDDYYSHAGRATFMRVIRIFGMMIGVLLPGVYVATQVFHYRVLPINFLISLLDSVQGLAFPPLIEILFVLFLFEILNEASVRMPKHLGMALSIIGALVLGDTAVQAGLISPPAILVVAISGITIYTVPGQVETMSLIRLFFTIIGGVAGYYGILVGTIFLFCYMCGLQSYGTPYLAPYAPNIKADKKDAITKSRLKAMKHRPQSIPHIDEIRLKNTDSTEEGTGQ